MLSIQKFKIVNLQGKNLNILWKTIELWKGAY